MSNEMCDFVKLVLDRMDTFPEEFIEGDPKHRWSTLVRGLVDWAMEETDTNAARSLWALEPHEREALTAKYKALYLESQKRAFLKNILGGDEIKSKKVQVVKKGHSLLTPAAITQQALNILEDQLTMTSRNNIVGASLGHSNNTNAYEYGWSDPRGTNDDTNNT
jgi:hypothetical protein